MNNNETINAAYAVALQLLESNPFVSPEDTACAIRARSGRIFTGVSRMNIHAEVEAIRNMQAAGEVIIDEFVLVGVQSRMQLLPCNNCAGYILSLHPENANCAVIMPDRAIRLAEVGMFAFNPTESLNQPFPGGPVMGGPIPPQPPVAPIAPLAPLVPPNFEQTPPIAPEPAPLRPLVVEPEPEPEPEPEDEFEISPKPEPEPENDDEDEDDSSPKVLSPDDFEDATAEGAQNFSGDILKSRVNSLLRVASDDDEEIDRITEKKKRFGFFRK